VKRLSKINNLTGVLIVAGLAIASCAKISAPVGGPKDTAPPVIVESVPENGSKLFSANSFTVTFDEYVTLDKITEKFMVSPPLKTKPEILLKGKSLIVKWDEKLADSTTYTFYFQDAIRDNNEGNIFNNYSYFFSTGNIIDSLSLTGNVFNADNLESSQDVLVVMYSNLSDTAPAKVIPSYIAKPDFSGGFTLNNVKPGDYRLYVLNDLNGNKLYDGGDEKFAFYDTVINITSDKFYGVKLDSVQREIKSESSERDAAAALKNNIKPEIFTFGKFKMFLFGEEKKLQYLTSSERSSAGSLMFTLALPADTSRFDFSLLGAPDSSWFMEQNNSGDTFRIWITDPEVYRTEILKALIKYPYTDSTKTLVYKSDTATVRFRTVASSPRGGREKKQALKLEKNLKSDIKPGTGIWFKGATPLNNPDTSKMIFIQEIDTISTRIKPVFERDGKDSRKVFLKTPLVKGATYSLVCKKAAFTDIYGLESDSTGNKFRIAGEDEYGEIIAALSGYNGRVIVQLLDDKETVLSQKVITAPGKVDFKLLEKGKYRLRAIYDLDNNGKFTTGDFYKKRQPEPVSYYYEVQDVKVNWVHELDDWNLGKKNEKSLGLRSKPESKTNSR